MTLISRLTEEKNAAAQLNNKLRQELVSMITLYFSILLFNGQESDDVLLHNI